MRPGNCALCGIWRQGLDKDHKIPKSKGGSDDPSNIQYICQNCHYDKTVLDRRDPEMRALISAANKGKVFSTEHRAKLRTSRRNRGPFSIETKAKISASSKGKKGNSSSFKLGHQYYPKKSNLETFTIDTLPEPQK